MPTWRSRQTRHTQNVVPLTGVRVRVPPLVPENSLSTARGSPYDIYIGRPSPWGNPFSDKPKSLAEVKTETREEAIACFEEWLRQNPEMIERAKRELRGKVLGCWCSPKACHGDVLAKIANEP